LGEGREKEKMTRMVKFVMVLLLACLFATTTSTVAVENSEVDGFDDVSDATLTKRVTEISADNLNPFQVEVFVSYCVA
jgi:hypothetical protein